MNRIAYIDLIKVYTIFLVILGHSTICGGIAKQWLYAFHMPVFFALYGLTYNHHSHAARGFLTHSFVAQKVKRLMIPAVIWALAYSIVKWLAHGFPGVKAAAGLLYFSQAGLKAAGSLTSIWFLPCMFLAVLLTEAIMQAISRPANTQKPFLLKLLMLSMVLAAITFLLPRLQQGYPWCINLVPLACAFILIGFLTRQGIIFLNSKRLSLPAVWIATFICAFAALSGTFSYNLRFVPIHNADMASACFGFPPLYMLDAVSGLFMMVALAKLTCPHRLHPVVAFMGSNTLAIFLIHKPLIVNLSDLLKTAGYHHTLAAIAVSVVILLISALIASLINRAYPFTIGNRKQYPI